MSASADRIASRLLLPDVVEEHAEEASFLWMLRDAAARSADYTLEELAELDDRLDAHLDGLRVSGDEGREIWSGVLAGDEASTGADFARGVLALQADDAGAWRALLDEARGDLARERELISALGWATPEEAQPRLRDMLVDPGLDPTGIALRGLAVHRQDPGQSLGASLGAENPARRARAARSAGELGRLDLAEPLAGALQDGDVAVRFAAGRALVQLGDARGAVALESVLGEPAPLAEEAAFHAFRLMDADRIDERVRVAAAAPAAKRAVIVGVGAAGDPARIPWLVECMADPELARLAGQSFRWITGVDLNLEKLRLETGDLEDEAPEEEDAGDEFLEMDADEDLPIPDPGKVEAWWEANRERFRAGRRTLGGERLDAGCAHRVLEDGTQPERRAAALEIVIAEPGRPLFEVRAPGPRQRAALASA